MVSLVRSRLAEQQGRIETESFLETAEKQIKELQELEPDKPAHLLAEAALSLRQDNRTRVMECLWPMKEGEKIPSVRELAVSMAINPNTIQKAYKELESEGYIYSVTAKGYFVTPRESTDVGKNSELLAKFSDTVHELMYLGKTKNELSDIINSIYKGGTNDGNDNG
jgi:GntR family transcriptional regulator